MRCSGKLLWWLALNNTLICANSISWHLSYLNLVCQYLCRLLLDESIKEAGLDLGLIEEDWLHEYEHIKLQADTKALSKEGSISINMWTDHHRQLKLRAHDCETTGQASALLAQRWFNTCLQKQIIYVGECITILQLQLRLSSKQGKLNMAQWRWYPHAYRVTKPGRALQTFKTTLVTTANFTEIMFADHNNMCQHLSSDDTFEEIFCDFSRWQHTIWSWV